MTFFLERGKRKVSISKYGAVFKSRHGSMRRGNQCARVAEEMVLSAFSARAHAACSFARWAATAEPSVAPAAASASARSMRSLNERRSASRDGGKASGTFRSSRMRRCSQSGNTDSGYRRPDMTATPFEIAERRPEATWPAWLVNASPRAKLLKAQAIKTAGAFLVEIDCTNLRLLVTGYQIVPCRRPLLRLQLMRALLEH